MVRQGDELVKRCHAASPGAEEDLAKYLVAIIPRWITASFSRLTPEDIEDLTTLLAVHILANISKFQGRSSFETWARRVTRNKVNDWIKKEGRRRSREIPLDVESQESGLSPADVLPARSLNPRQELDRKIARELAMECLERVRNPRQKLIMKEHFVGGLSVGEIAERWGVKKRAKLDVLLWQALQAYFRIVKDLHIDGRQERFSDGALRE
jgi:RNA polymerase sigma factor (sigma-70 family)